MYLCTNYYSSVTLASGSYYHISLREIEVILPKILWKSLNLKLKTSAQNRPDSGTNPTFPNEFLNSAKNLKNARMKFSRYGSSSQSIFYKITASTYKLFCFQVKLRRNK